MNKQDNQLQEYKLNSMHMRTIKLFRWHLDKQNDCTLDEVEKCIHEFQKKYDVTGDDFLHPITLALTNQLKKTDLIMLIHTLGKDQVMERLEHFLTSK